MANKENLIRDEIKICRDGVKANYKKGTECFICDSTESLQLHHYYSFSYLWENWKKKNKIHITSFEDVVNCRQDFYKDNWDKLVGSENTVTLCSTCHNEKLHKIYGKSPTLGTAKKQKRWAQIQRDKTH